MQVSAEYDLFKVYVYGFKTKPTSPPNKSFPDFGLFGDDRDLDLCVIGGGVIC